MFGQHVEENLMDREGPSALEVRIKGLESLFGASDPTHLHGVTPFSVGVDLGGTPDIISFSDFTRQGTLYVTAELVGTESQLPNSVSQYELAVCLSEPAEWALDLLCGLAAYTLRTPLDHGDTMDIEAAAPKGSSVTALLFRSIGEYKAFGKAAHVVCCVGITANELEFALQNGSDALMDRLPKSYIATDSARGSFV